MPKAEPADIRFWRYVMPEPNSGCWIWMGGLQGKGYASFLWEKGRTRHGHRYIYEKTKGPIPAGLEIDHKCHVRCCVNPDHLEVVTHAENIRRSAHIHRAAMAAQAAARTHCPSGHAFTEANARVNGDNSRHCRECCKLRERERRRRLRGIT